MPSVSKKQHNFMAAVANSPKFAKKVGVPRSVGEEFLTADKGKKFREGGTMKESKAMAKREVAFMKKKGAPATMIKHEEKEVKEMKKGGLSEKIRNEKDEMKRVRGEMAYDMGKKAMGMKKGGMAECKSEAKKEVKAHEKRMHGMAKGGVTRADGCVSKGHTKGTMVKMYGGGKC